MTDIADDVAHGSPDDVLHGRGVDGRGLDGGLAVLDQACVDYDRVGRALAFLGEHWRERADYVAAAAHVGLSASHFHRMFSRWVGVSPKAYVAALALHEAHGALDGGASVEEAAWGAGYSGASRLYDAFIAHEGVTPGDAKRRGAGISFVWGVGPTPFGMGVFLVNDRGLCGLGFVDADGDDAALGRAYRDLADRFPAAEYSRDDDVARAWAGRVFASDEAVPLALYGSAWRLKVWRALLRIPPGETVSYRAIAEDVGTAKASRAVGAAVGANPVSFLVPCHRVLASDGRLTGYHWGVNRKRAMLAFEAVRANV